MPARLGRYEVIRELGKGAMGVVYEGKDPNIGRRVAIKTARREVVEASGMADEMMERFLREAKAAGALNHPNIITIYDAAEEDGIAYIAMEYLEGGDLGDIIDTRKRLGMEEIVEIGAYICEALHVAHEHGVVHRDIKPANILMPTDKPLKVADFGIAHVSDSNLTQDGALIGTPHYMSPEQFMGQKLDGRSDLFSVGNILYELTTGEKPFGGEALSTVMHKVIKTDPVSPTELNFAIPDALAQVIMKALSKRPANRYKTGNEMAAALRESIKENPNPAILDPGAQVAMAATMAAPAPAAVQATMIAPPDSEDLKATVPGVRPASQETTLSGPVPGATIPGGGPAPGATVAGPPPAGTELGATVPVSGPAPLPTVEKSGGNKGLLIGGGIAAALVVIVGGIMMSGGDKTETPAETPVPVTSNATPTETPPTTNTDNYYTMIVFNVFRAKDEETYHKFNRQGVGTEQLAGKLEDIVGPFPIEVLDGSDTVLKTLEYTDSGDFLEFSKEDGKAQLRYRAYIPSTGTEPILSKGDIPAPTKPEASTTIEVVLSPSGPSQ